MKVCSYVLVFSLAEVYTVQRLLKTLCGVVIVKDTGKAQGGIIKCLVLSD